MSVHSGAQNQSEYGSNQPSSMASEIISYYEKVMKSQYNGQDMRQSYRNKQNIQQSKTDL